MAIAAEHDGKALERSLQVPAGARGLRATPRARGRALTRRLLFAQLAPLVLLALAVCAIYAVHALQRVPAASTAHALALSVSLGQAAEFGVFARRVSSLDRLLQRALHQPGVVAAVVYDQAGNAIVARGEASVLAPALIVGSDSPRVLAERAGRLVVAAPIVIEPLDVGDASGSGDRARVANLAETIGWVQVDVDSGRDTPGAGGAGLWILLFALGAVAFAALLAVRLARSIGDPAARLSEALGRLAAGDLNVRVPVDAGSEEFRALQEGLNSLARSIADSHRRMLATIDITTDRLAHQAMHDPLTGLPNRRMFEQVLEEAVLASRRAADHGTLCYIDLDHFKHVNDSCGHAAGDALLGEVAALIGQRMRAQDLICRIGGDEFALILRGCSPEDARRIAEDLCTAVGALNFEWEGKSFHIGASVGLARIDDPLNTPSAVLKAADTACYAAKRTGRSQVMEYCATLSC